MDDPYKKKKTLIKKDTSQVKNTQELQYKKENYCAAPHCQDPYQDA